MTVHPGSIIAIYSSFQLMPVLKSFCIYCSIGIFFLFLMQSTLFPACLTLNQRRIEARRDGLVPCIKYSPDYEPNKISQVSIVHTVFKKNFAPVLLSIPGKVRFLYSVDLHVFYKYEQNPQQHLYRTPFSLSSILPLSPSASTYPQIKSPDQ